MLNAKLFKNPYHRANKTQNSTIKFHPNSLHLNKTVIRKRELSFNLPVQTEVPSQNFGKKINFSILKKYKRFKSEKKDLPSIKTIKFNTPLNQSINKKRGMWASNDLSPPSFHDIKKRNYSVHSKQIKRNKTNTNNSSYSNILNLSFSNDFVSNKDEKFPSIDKKRNNSKNDKKNQNKMIYNNTLNKPCLKTLSEFDIHSENNNFNLSFGNEQKTVINNKKKKQIEGKTIYTKISNQNLNGKTSKIFWLNSNKNSYTTPIYFQNNFSVFKNNHNTLNSKGNKNRNSSKIKSRKEILSSLLHTTSLEVNYATKKASDNTSLNKRKIPFQYRHQHTTMNKSVDLNSTFKKGRIPSFQHLDNFSRGSCSDLSSNNASHMALPPKKASSLFNLLNTPSSSTNSKNNLGNKSCSSLLLTPPPQKTKLPPLNFLSSVNTNVIKVKILSYYNSEKKKSKIRKIHLYDKNNSKIPISFITYSSEVNNSNFLKIYYSKDKKDDEIKTIGLYNDKENKIKEIEIYGKKNKSLLWKGVIPNNTSEYKININKSSIEIFSSDNEEPETEKPFKKKVGCKKTPSSKTAILSKLKISDTLLFSNIKNRKSNEYYKTITSFHKNTFSTKNTLQVNSNYIVCKKIKIVFLSNYGHKSHIGLTGIELLSKNNTVIDIESASSIGALPKNLVSHNKKYENQIFENLFNNVNQTIDTEMMWLTNNIGPFLEISFNNPIFLSSIRFWNYNSPDELDKGVKQFQIYFDETYNSSHILRLGIGDDSIDYSQIITFPYVPIKYTPEEIEPFRQIKNASMLYNQRYETPYLPSGFVFTFLLISNWGGSSCDSIGLEEIKMYDQLGREILVNHKTNMNTKGYMEDFFNYKKHYDEIYYDKETFGEGFTGGNSSQHHRNIQRKKHNSIFIIYDRCVSVSYIRILNYRKDINKSVSKMIIKCDEKIIFDGEINKYTTNNGGYTTILFTCDLNITKDIKESELSGYENEIKNQLNNIYLYTNPSENEDQLENRKAYKNIKYEHGVMLVLI